MNASSLNVTLIFASYEHKKCLKTFSITCISDTGPISIEIQSHPFGHDVLAKGVSCQGIKSTNKFNIFRYFITP